MSGSVKVVLQSIWDDKGVKSAVKELDNLGKKAQVALAAVGVAAVGLGAVSIREFAKFDAALTKSTAIMGDVSESLRTEMGNAAREVAKVTTFSAEQAAEAYFFLASAGLSAEASISALPAVAQFAQAGMFDMATATELLADAQSALGMTIRDDANANMANLIQLSDTLVRANTLANASVQQFSEALTNKAAASMRSLGIEMETGIAVLATFADQGIKGSQAGTTFNAMLRGLTNGIVTNTAEFEKYNIQVFDSEGNMNNLADIVAQMETAFSGMSVEQKRAALTSLGMTEETLAGTLALLGNSEAIKRYEKELRSSAGFTEKVASKQLETFSSQMKLLQSAFEDVAIQIGAEMTPAFQDLVPVIQELLPEIGEKLVAAVKQVDWSKLTTDIGNFITAIIQNIDVIAQLATGVLILVVALAAMRVLITTVAAIQAAIVVFKAFQAIMVIATAKQIAFNIAVLANPYVAAAAAIILALSMIAVGIYTLTNNANKNKEATERQTKAFSQTRAEFNNTADAARRLNGINFEAFRGQMGDTRQDAEKLTEAQRELAYYMAGGKPGGYKPRSTTTTTTTTTTPTGKTPAEIRQEQIEAAKKAFDQVSKLVRNTQKKITEAQSSYDTAVNKATQDNLASIAQIRKDYADKISDIIEQSQDRLRSAFASATAINLSSIFDADNKARKQAAEAVGKAVADTEKARERLTSAQEKLREATTENQRASAAEAIAETKSELDRVFAAEEDARKKLKEATAKSSAEAMVENLRGQLTASRNLLARSGELAALGFTQTFIEQVVSAGTETGNELAAAILQSTPETQAELRGLFQALETTSETGMDSLAKSIYEQQGLATSELRNLYKETGAELDKALIDQQTAFQTALRETAQLLSEKLRDIKDSFAEDVKELEGAYGGLKSVVDGVAKSLGLMVTKADAAAKAAGAAAVKAAESTRAAIDEIENRPAAAAKPEASNTAETPTRVPGLQGFGDPEQVRRQLALQAAGEALNVYGQEFVNKILGQRSFTKDGQRTFLSPGADQSLAGSILAQGFVEEIMSGGVSDKANLALALAEQIYGVDIGGLSTPGQVGGNTFNITVNAGAGTDPVSTGRAIVDAIKRYESVSGRVFATA